MSVNVVQSNKTFTDLYGDHSNNIVVFGNPDAPDEFQAHVKLQFWGEDTVTLFEPGIRGDAKLVSDKIELDLPTRKLAWYQYQSSLKWVFTLKTKPMSNRYAMQLGAQWNDFTWAYQPPFREEYPTYPESAFDYFDDDGIPSVRVTHPAGGPDIQSWRALDVEGSYAVFHKTKCNDYSKMGGKNYRTGKVLHIYRPRATDAVGKSVWCDLYIENGLYQVTIPQKFLDQAIYPALINDTFGYTTIGGTQSSSTAGRLHVNGSGSPAVSGTATSMSFYGYKSGGCPFTMGFYNDNTGPEGAALQADTGEISLTDTASWNNANLDSPVAVSSATTYYSGWNGETAGYEKFHDADSQTLYYTTSAYVAGVLPNPCPSGMATAANRRYSIYVIFTPGGAAGQPTMRRRCGVPGMQLTGRRSW